MAQSKITFIYAYEEENWSTPMALANEFMNQGWECEVVSNYSVASFIKEFVVKLPEGENLDFRLFFELRVVEYA